MKIPKEYTFNPLMYESRYIKSSQPLKIIMFGDSFSPFLTKFLKEHFREIVVIWGYKFDEKIIIDEKPDIVILEIVERNIDLLIEDI